MTKLRYADPERRSTGSGARGGAPRRGRRIPGADPRGSRAERRRRRRRQRRLVGASVLVLLVAAGFGLFSLRASRIQVAGVVVADQGRLEELLGPCLGERLALLDVGELRREILADPWITGVDIRRWVDGSLRIRVEEASPAFVLADESGAVCRDGNHLPLREGLELAGLPLLSAPRSGEGSQLSGGAVEAVRRLTSALDRTPWTWPNGLRSVEIDGDGNVTITTGGGVAVALGSRGWSHRLMALAATFPVLRPGPGDRLDLRFERQVVLESSAAVDGRVGG